MYVLCKENREKILYAKGAFEALFEKCKFIQNKDGIFRILERDNFTCQLCGKTDAEQRLTLNESLSVNHIDHDKKNNDDSNLNRLLCTQVIQRRP